MTNKGLTADLSDSIAKAIYSSGAYSVYGWFGVSQQEFSKTLEQFLNGNKSAFAQLLQKKDWL